jgi:Flp pilus assembly pilin Flp
MTQYLRRLWAEQDGVLSFEWTLIVTLLVIGVVGGIAAARDAIVEELGDAAQAMLALDDSYELDSPLRLAVSINGEPAEIVGVSAGSLFIDSLRYADCARATGDNLEGQEDNAAALEDTDS